MTEGSRKAIDAAFSSNPGIAIAGVVDVDVGLEAAGHDQPTGGR